MLSTIERRHEIVLSTEKHGKVSVKELSKDFNISSVTIRNDLNELHKLGLLVRSRGGAVASSRLIKELSPKDKQKITHKSKHHLSKRVAELIKDYDSLVLDASNITAEIAKYIARKNGLTVVTNGLNIASELAVSENCDLILTGGKLHKNSMAFYDIGTEKKLAGYNFNKVVIEADGIDINRGISSQIEPKAIFNKAMCANAESVIVVVDSSKFNKNSLHAILPFEQVDVLVTDSGIPDEYISACEKLNIELHIVDSE